MNYKKLSYPELFKLYNKVNHNNGKENNAFLDGCSLTQRAHLACLFGAEYHIADYGYDFKPKSARWRKEKNLLAKENRMMDLGEKFIDLINVFFESRNAKTSHEDAVNAIKYNFFEAYSAFLEHDNAEGAKIYKKRIRENKKKSVKLNKSKIECEKIYKLRSLL